MYHQTYTVQVTPLDMFIDWIRTLRRPLLLAIDKQLTEFLFLTRPLDGRSMASNLLAGSLNAKVWREWFNLVPGGLASTKPSCVGADS